MSTAGASPEAVPASTAELSEVARGVAELLDRVTALESQIRALASALDVAELIGETPQRGRGLSCVLSRIDAVERGVFGARGIDAFAEQLAQRRRRRATGSGNEFDDRLRAEIISQSRKLGARIRSDGGVEWPSPNGLHVTAEYAKEWRGDIDGRKRAARARQLAMEEVLVPTRPNPAGRTPT